MVVLTEDSPLTKLVKKGEAEQLARTKGLQTIGDLFEFVPRRYVRPGQLTDLSSLRVGEDVLVVAVGAEERDVELVPVVVGQHDRQHLAAPGSVASSSARSAPTASGCS